MRPPGVRLAIDVGKARVGVARSDPDGLLALPVDTLDRDQLLPRITEMVTRWDVVDIIVGLPLSLSGGDTASTTDARQVASELAKTVSCPVWLVDERLTTVSAMGDLHRGGRTTKTAKPVIDQASAVIILQHCLDGLASRGIIPGSRVEGSGGD